MGSDSALDGADGWAPGACVALGVFDGVHLGHRALIAAAADEARRTGGYAAALTFDPHPAALFAPSSTPPLLGTLDERRALLREAGARAVAVARFDRAFASQSPEAFAREVLARRLGARAVVVGEDFRFGAGQAGDAAALAALGERLGFSVRVVPQVTVDGVPARSRTIRGRLADGDVAGAAALLGRDFARTALVVRGRQLGRTLGWPTANLAPTPGLATPGAGVYAGRATCDAGTFAAAVSVGVNVTIDEDAAPTVEAHLLDFDGDLYDRPLTVAFVRRLRGMVKFDGLDALTAQIARDVDATRRCILPLP